MKTKILVVAAAVAFVATGPIRGSYNYFWSGAVLDNSTPPGNDPSSWTSGFVPSCTNCSGS